MRFLALLPLVILGGCHAASPDPMRILELAAGAISRVDAVSYDFEYRRSGGEEAAMQFAGTLLLQRMEDSLNYRMRLSGSMNGKTVAIVADGETIASLDADHKEILRSSIFAAGGTLRAAALPAVMEAFLKPDPFRDEMTAGSVSLEGRDAADGRPCDILRVDYTDDEEDSRWCFDSESHLPVRLEWIAPDGVTELLELSSLAVNPPVGPHDFVMETPAGFGEASFSLGVHEGSMAPDWTLREPDGDEVTSTSLRGRVVVLDFWASWCPPCIDSLAALERLEEDLAGKPVTIYGVQVMDTRDPVAFMQDHGLHHGLLVNGEEVLTSMMGGPSIPSAIVIDPEGRVVGTTSGYYGEGSHRYLHDLVERALEMLPEPEA